MRTLVVVPTYQEAENIGPFLRRLRAAVPDADVLVVDDDSPDGTAAAARAMAGEVGGVEVLNRGPKAGLGTAYRTGLGLGLEQGYDVLVQIDADLSHDPAALPQLLQAVANGADIAVGSRYVPGGSIPNWPVYRRALSRYGNRYASIMLRLGISDATSGYRAYRGDMARSLDLATTQAGGYGFQIELAYRAARQGGRIVEVPITFTDRVRGTSKMSWRIITEAMWLVTRWGLRDRLRGRAGSGPRRAGPTSSRRSGR